MGTQISAQSASQSMNSSPKPQATGLVVPQAGASQPSSSSNAPDAARI